MTDIAPHLCNQLEVTYSFFETLTSAAPSGLPAAAAGPLPAAAAEHNAAFIALMRIFLHVVKWAGFDRRNREDDLRRLLQAVASRLGTEPTNMAGALTEASRYFAKYANKVPTAEALLVVLELLAAIAARAGE